MTGKPVRLILVSAESSVTESYQRRADCANYNDCLSVAALGDWDGFACNGCNSYEEMDFFQKTMDVCGLNAMMAAAEHLEKTGVAGRKRGARPNNVPKAKPVMAESEIADDDEYVDEWDDYQMAEAG